ncbi:MAG: phage virion morphogenesis protein [Ornithinimicrobium sp.]
MDYEIEFYGDRELIASLERTADGVINLTSPMREIGMYLRGFFSGEVFASRGGVIGRPWAPLSTQYAALKARQWPGRPPLIRSGQMLRSFKSTPSQQQVEIRNTAPYFDWHQDGTTKMPARVMMAVDMQRTQKVAQIINEHIQRAAA